jgi:MFS family permease
MSILWNLSSAATFFATSFWTLFWPRVLFGIFSSALDPAALRLSAKFFPTWRRGFATGLFISCLYIGAAISSICLVITEAIGWRLTYVLVALIGCIITAIVGPFIKSLAPKPAVADGPEERLTQQATPQHEEVRPIREDMKELVKNKTLIYITIIGFFRFAATYARTFFEPEFFTRTYSDMKTVYSFCNAVIVILTCFGPIVGGHYTDKHEATNPKLRPLVCW